MNLIIARHGQTQWNAEKRYQGQNSQIGLTELGKQQATAVGQLLSEISIDVMYASPILRAWETAGIISEHINIPAQKESSIAELNAGNLEGLTKIEADKKYPGMWDERNNDRLNFKGHGGESYVEGMQRAMAFVTVLNQKHAGENVLLVTHGGIIKAILADFLNLKNNIFLRNKIPHFCVHFAAWQPGDLRYLEHTTTEWNACFPGYFKADTLKV